MGTFLVLDIPKVPSDSTIWELRKSIVGIFGMKNLSRLDSRDMWIYKTFYRLEHLMLPIDLKCGMSKRFFILIYKR